MTAAPLHDRAAHVQPGRDAVAPGEALARGQARVAGPQARRCGVRACARARPDGGRGAGNGVDARRGEGRRYHAAGAVGSGGAVRGSAGLCVARPGERCLDYRLPAPGRRCHAERRASGARAQLGQYSDMMVLAYILSATGWCEQGAQRALPVTGSWLRRELGASSARLCRRAGVKRPVQQPTVYQVAMRVPAVLQHAHKVLRPSKQLRQCLRPQERMR